MAKISGKYEIVYIIDPAQGEEGIAALVEKFKAMVEAERYSHEHRGVGQAPAGLSRSTTCPRATMS